MSHVSMILTGLMMMSLVVFMAPNIFALNRGHILRNVALWLAIFFGLGAFYQSFGPDSPHPLFQLPVFMQGMNKSEAPQLKLPFAKDGKENKDGSMNGDSSDNGEQGYTPPKE
jgi:hypothetical protein